MINFSFFVFDFITNIFSSEGFVTRSRCGASWTTNLIMSSQFANMIIMFGYLIIGLQFYSFYLYRNQELTNKRSYQLLTLFPIVCGISRINNIAVFMWAPYRFYIVLDWCCALSVTLLAYRFRDLIDYLLNLEKFKNRLEYVDFLDEKLKRQKELQFALQNNNQQLLLLVQQLHDIIQGEMWIHDKNQVITELKNILTSIEMKP